MHTKVLQNVPFEETWSIDSSVYSSNPQYHTILINYCACVRKT